MVPFELGGMDRWQTTGAIVALAVPAFVYLIAAAGALWVTHGSPVAATRQTARAAVLGTGIGFAALAAGLLWYWSSLVFMYPDELQAQRLGVAVYLVAILMAAVVSGVIARSTRAPISRSVITAVVSSIAFLVFPFVSILLEFQTQCVTGFTIWMRGALLCS